MSDIQNANGAYDPTKKASRKGGLVFLIDVFSRF